MATKIKILVCEKSKDGSINLSFFKKHKELADEVQWEFTDDIREAHNFKSHYYAQKMKTNLYYYLESDEESHVIEVDL